LLFFFYFASPSHASDTLEWSVVQQGDRGSTPQKLRQLFPPDQYPQFDFDPVAKYCLKRGIANGQWWHHNGLVISETEASFKRRTVEFKQWLAKMYTKHNYSHILVGTELLSVRLLVGWFVVFFTL
jgi:hypothetical protein